MAAVAVAGGRGGGGWFIVVCVFAERRNFPGPVGRPTVSLQIPCYTILRGLVAPPTPHSRVARLSTTLVGFVLLGAERLVYSDFLSPFSRSLFEKFRSR